MNLYPNDPDLAFKKITLLNKLGKTENVINSTEALIEILENRQNVHWDGTSFDEENIGDHEFKVYHNSNHKTKRRIKKRSRWDAIQNTIWYDFDIFEPRKSLGTFWKEKKSQTIWDMGYNCHNFTSDFHILFMDSWGQTGHSHRNISCLLPIRIY